MQRFGSTAFESSARAKVRFEVVSRVGRWLSPRYRTPAAPFLHIGCGLNLFEGYENIDFFAVRFWRSRHIGHDLRYPLPYHDNVFDGAFSEHALEHLPASAALTLLAEVHRVLKPGAVFRISVPDLGKYIAFYSGNLPHPDFGQFSNGCEAIWSITQNWGHVSCWDADMLVRQLLDAGFREAAPSTFGQGANDKLLLERVDRAWESLYVEAIA